MILSAWPQGVNTRFFSLSKKPKENTEQTEYTSGRVVSWQKNTKKQFNISVKIMLNTSDELPTFWDWFNDVLGQTAGAFTCGALGDGYYRFIQIPDPEDTDTINRVLSLELEEV